MAGSVHNGQMDLADARALVDPEVAPLIDALPLIDLDPASLPAARRAADVHPKLFDERLQPTKVLVEREDEPAIGVLVFDPPGQTGRRAAILHLHGGGMVFGSSDMARVFAPQIALDHGVVVVSVDYRLAPETRFPGQLEDAARVLGWMRHKCDALSIDPDAIYLMGESAGGGLAAGLALMLRDSSGPKVAGQILTYPMLDHRTGETGGGAGLGAVGRFIWTPARNRFGWQALTGEVEPEPAKLGWFSPALADCLAGLPPTFLAVGSLDLFLAENLEFVRRLGEAGVSTEAHCYSGAIHGFDLMRRSGLATRYRRDLSAWLKRSLDGRSHPMEELPSAVADSRVSESRTYR